jgi:hypothetical protein
LAPKASLARWARERIVNENSADSGVDATSEQELKGLIGEMVQISLELRDVVSETAAW